MSQATTVRLNNHAKTSTSTTNAAPTLAGVVTTDLGNDDGESITVQPDGKILLGGTSYSNSSGSMMGYFALMRYNTDGSLDTSFGSDGKVTTAVGSIYASGHSVTVQTDNKILLGGGSDYNFALVRYNTDGSLDASFDSDGKVITDLGGGSGGQSVTVQADGKILLCGPVAASSNNTFGLVRYNTNGSLDTSFDSDGKVITDLSSNNAVATSVTLQTDGKILVAGYHVGAD